MEIVFLKFMKTTILRGLVNFLFDKFIEIRDSIFGILMSAIICTVSEDELTSFTQDFLTLKLWRERSKFERQQEIIHKK